MTSSGYGIPFVGRAEELGALTGALDAAGAGHGHLVAISGETGIGKTRLMAEFAGLAETLGNRVLWSQMAEDPGAPPYFPWRLALRASLQIEDSRDAMAGLGAGAADLANILPELQDEPSIAERDTPADSRSTRYQLYDSVTRYLLALAKQQPLVILLDNLHLADQSSLGLLSYFCQHLAGQKLLVAAAYRDSDFDRHRLLRPTLDTVSRTTGFTRLAMNGLSRPEVADLLRRFLSSSPPVSVLDSVFRQSDGNPLFVTEVGSMLARSAGNLQNAERAIHFSVPESLREVIATRLDALPEETKRMLRVAAIVGREFDLPCVADLCAAGRGGVAHALQHAEMAGIIETAGPDRFRFHHVLFREVLYSEHNTVSRVLLHRRAGEHLERRYSDNLQPHLTQLAHHYFEAAQTGREEKAIHFCRLAAENASARRAYSEATAFLENALQVQELQASGSDDVRFELLMELGQAKYQSGHLNESTTTLMKAAIIAHRERWWPRLANALFLFQYICQQSGIRHVASIPLHRAVLDNLPASSPALRARVLASLGRAYRTNGNSAAAVRAFRESIALARKLDDPCVLLACLTKGAWTIGRRPDGAREGLEISLEALELARVHGPVGAVMDSLADIVFQLCDLGDITEAERRLSELKALAIKERHVHFLIIVSGFETSVAILRGQWEPARRLASKALHSQSLTGVFGLEGRYAFQMFAIHAAQGKLSRVANDAASFIANSQDSRLWLPGQVLLHCELGQEAEARAALERLGDVRSLPRDDLYPVALVYLADACARLGDATRSSQLIDLLMPYRGLNITLAGTLMLGAASGYLAMLAVATRRGRLARALFEEAIELDTDMRAFPILARVMVEYAQLRQSSERTGDKLEAGALLDRASGIAERLGLQPVIERIQVLRKDSGNGRLTRREAEILELIAEGKSNLKIADSLHISHSTVATHVRNIFRKIGATNRTEAAEHARRSGLIPLR